MRLAIMQPYFFPYVGYFSLLAAVDRFVVFDPVQYIRHGWINRNRILKPDRREAQYINVPLAKHSRETKIRDIRISTIQPWKERILGQVQHYRKRAPNFLRVESMLKQCFALETDRIVDLNVHCLEVVCRNMGIEFDYLLFDELESQIGLIEQPDEWALEIAKAMGATAYVNPIGGRDIFDASKFSAAGIELEFVQNSLTEYSQGSLKFIPGLSILDLLMFNGSKEANRLVHDFRIANAHRTETKDAGPGPVSLVTSDHGQTCSSMQVNE